MVETITAQELKEKKDNADEFVLVDVLGEDSYQEQHIPGAINIPVTQIEEQASQHIPETGTEIVVYCADTECHASPKAAEKLEELGYTNVKDFEAGLAGWEEAGYQFA